jgi:hypothetical protein
LPESITKILNEVAHADLLNANHHRTAVRVVAIGRNVRTASQPHDPVPQTGAWLKSVVQGYFNYYAVPGNLDSLGLFRERVLRYWGK